MCENYNIIAESISAIRPLLKQQNSSIPEDNLIVDAYEELAIFIISNFPTPTAHVEYILQSLDLPENTINLLAALESKLKNIKGNFSLELPLRALEVYFSFGKPDIDVEIIDKLKYLISKLHHLAGENYKFA